MSLSIGVVLFVLTHLEQRLRKLYNANYEPR